MSNTKPIPHAGPFWIIPYTAAVITIITTLNLLWEWLDRELDSVNVFVYEKAFIILNAFAAIVAIILWFSRKKEFKVVKNFTLPWIGFWIGTLLHFTYLLVVNYYPEQKNFQLDLFLNNANTIFIFLIYLVLSYPTGKDFERKDVVFSTSFSSFITFMMIVALTHVFPQYGNIVSGVFAFFGFAFLTARLESYFPKASILIIILFTYAAVQLMWIPDEVLLTPPSDKESLHEIGIPRGIFLELDTVYNEAKEDYEKWDSIPKYKKDTVVKLIHSAYLLEILREYKEESEERIKPLQLIGSDDLDTNKKSIAEVDTLAVDIMRIMEELSVQKTEIDEEYDDLFEARSKWKLGLHDEQKERWNNLWKSYIELQPRIQKILELDSNIYRNYVTLLENYTKRSEVSKEILEETEEVFEKNKKAIVLSKFQILFWAFLGKIFLIYIITFRFKTISKKALDKYNLYVQEINPDVSAEE